MATLSNFFNSVNGRKKPLSGYSQAFGESNWRSDPRSNPSLSPVNDDYAALAYGQAENELARQLLTRSQANEAKRKLDFLKSFANQSNLNAFQAPRDDREAMMQDLLQEQSDAQARGWQISLRDRDRRREESIEDLKYNIDIAQNARADQSAGRQDYRAGLENERLRLAFQKADVSAKQGEERNRQGAERNEFRVTQASDRELDEEYNHALELINEGMSPEDILRDYNMDARTAQKLQSYGRNFQKQEGQVYDSILNRADALNQLLASPDPGSRRIAMDMYQKDRNLKEMLIYDPSVDAFSPTVPRPVPPPISGRGQGRAPLPAGPIGNGRVVQVRSPEEARRLPPGTLYRTPDGRVLRIRG